MVYTNRKSSIFSTTKLCSSALSPCLIVPFIKLSFKGSSNNCSLKINSFSPYNLYKASFAHQKAVNFSNELASANSFSFKNLCLIFSTLVDIFSMSIPHFFSVFKVIAAYSFACDTEISTPFAKKVYQTCRNE